MGAIEGNAVIGQSGGPTAVINRSLVGVVDGLKPYGAVKRILGMRHGVRGLTEGNLVDLTEIPDQTLALLGRTPSAALGSTRDKPDQAYCERIFAACRRDDIRYFFYIGGNDSSDTCKIVNELSNQAGYELRCFHVPKTVDNDLPVNDHTPGYPSAARFVAMAFMADSLDNASIPGIKINIVMGRNAGFLTAASAMARRNPDDGPHLIYLPEVPFVEDQFISDVTEVYARLGRCQIAVSEGVQDEAGTPIAAKLIKDGQTDAHGNLQLSGSGALGDLLATLIKSRVTDPAGKAPRVRADTFGYLQRCWPDQARVDHHEAYEVGRFAAQLAGSDNDDGSVVILRKSDDPYNVQYRRVDLAEVAAKTRHMPENFISGTHDVSEAFVKYATPLVGDLPQLVGL